MQKKIFLNLLVVSVCGIILSTTVFFAIQTSIAQKSADEIAISRLNNVEEHICSNNQKLNELIEIVREDNIARARAMAILIDMEPNIIKDASKLKDIAAALSIDEIHIIDENGILRWGTQPFKYGMNFANGEQTLPFLAILNDPSVEISQVPMPNASLGVIRQYAGVSLRQAKGIVEIGVIPHRMLEAFENARIGNVLRDIKIGNMGYIFSISPKTGLISSHPNQDMIGRQPPVTMQDAGFMNIDGQKVRYYTRNTPEEILVAAFPTAEMYEQRTFSTNLFLIFTAILFVLCSIMINSYIKRNIVAGIQDVLLTLDEITAGNLNVTANVRSSEEFHKLSDGINLMLASIKAKMNEVEEAVTAAVEASKSKSIFLANMSHEIRTPMNGIIGMTDLMLGEGLSGRQLQYVKDIKSSSESLLVIINDILDISKINENKLKITPVDIDLNVQLKNIVSMMKFSAHSKNLEFIEDIRINSPEYVRVDDVRLNQIIINLLSNAVKFTKAGHVKLMARIEGGNIVIAVSDTGIGISQDDLPLIFAAFEQVDQQKNHAIKGTGLGLSITKSLVGLMKGKIWVESNYGSGTTFHVTLPYVPGDETAVEPVDTEFSYIFAPTAQVLLVDDIQTNLTVGAGLLRLCGITADVAISGHEAIELVKAKDYDIVFMDHMMPEMDGVEAMDLIRNLGEKYSGLPIVALTANAVNESKEMLLASGMNDFLSKPIDKSALMNILKKWLPAHKIEASLKHAVPERNVPYSAILVAAEKIEGLDIKLALSRISAMQDILEKSLNQTAHSISERLKRMDTCLAHGDLRGFAVDAHGLKGALSNIGAVHNSELAAELEIASKAENRQLCLNKFPIFADIMEGFANELKALFVKPETENKPSGDSAFLAHKIEEVIGCLNSFEAAEAAERLAELEQFTFGAETDTILSDVKTMLKSFKYKKAVALLKDLQVTINLSNSG